jgi:hypothetical protein
MIIDALLLAQGKVEHGCHPWPFLGLVAFAAFVIFCVYRIGKFFDSGRKEQKLIRMELGKVAEEVHLLRQELKGDKESDSSA